MINSLSKINSTTTYETLKNHLTIFIKLEYPTLPKINPHTFEKISCIFLLFYKNIEKSGQLLYSVRKTKNLNLLIQQLTSRPIYPTPPFHIYILQNTPPQHLSQQHRLWSKKLQSIRHGLDIQYIKRTLTDTKLITNQQTNEIINLQKRKPKGEIRC